MPRKYIVRDGDNIEYKTVFEDGNYSNAEAKILGNTDWDAINNPIPAFNFVLMVEAVYFLPVKTVRAFTKENEFEYIKEGGVNDYVHMKRKPISKPFTFQIERYVGTERFMDPLALGTELILPVVLFLYRHKARSGWSDSAPAFPARLYAFTGCVVTSKEYGELNAERAGLLTETTTIAYREMVVLSNGFESLGINFMSAEQKEWNPDDNKETKGPGYKTKYAAFSKLDDKSQSSYLYEWTEEDGISRMKMKPDAGYKLFKEKWDGKPASKTWAKKSRPDEANKTYEVKDVGGKPTMVRKDTGDYNRPQYELAKDKDKEKYAVKAYVDQNSGEKIYDKNKDKSGQTHIKRVDHAQINKPAWTGENGAKNQWASTSVPDKNNKVYTVTTKDGVSTVKRKDSSPYNRPQYELKKDKEKQKYSEMSPIDKNEKIYQRNGDKFERIDKAQVNKKPYEISKDRQKNKYAAVSPKDKETPEAKDPYSIADDGATPKYAQESPVDDQKPVAKDPYKISDGATAKYAAKSPKDSEKAEAKDPYKISDGAAPKYAQSSPKDSEKAEVKGPYSIKDGATPKFAASSPVDSQKAPAVTWPPTRRALTKKDIPKK
ncbi:MAG: hypothetical protein K6E91_02450 [Butyrivibrio sp.]|nr:hypothetical protein [Butyrivibrio sp.]